MSHFIWATIVVCLLLHIWYLRRYSLMPSAVFRREVFRRGSGHGLSHERYDFTIWFRGANESYEVSEPDAPIRRQLMAIAEDWGPRLDEEAT